jgi:hypothetical protein
MKSMISVSPEKFSEYFKVDNTTFPSQPAFVGSFVEEKTVMVMD